MNLPTIAVALALPAASLTAPDPVNQLVARLGSASFRDREAASKELAALGSPALPALRRAAKSSPDAEVVRRAAAAAGQISRRLENERLLAPTLVQLDFTDTPLAVVQAELRKQLGAPFTLDVPAGQKTVTVKTDGRVPFWDAVAAVCEAAELEPVAITPVHAAGTGNATREKMFAQQLALIAGKRAEVERKLNAVQGRAGDDKKKEAADLQQEKLKLDRMLTLLVQQQARLRLAERSRLQPAQLTARVDTSRVTLTARSQQPLPSCVSGAVRVAVAPYPDAARSAVRRDSVPVLLGVSPEPKLRWQQVESVRITRALDEAGNELTVASGEVESPGRVDPVRAGGLVVRNNGVIVEPPSPGVPNFSPTATTALVRLRFRDTPPRKLQTLEGVVRGTLRGGEEVLATVAGLDGKPNAAAVGPGGVNLGVTVATRDGNGACVLSVVVRYDPTAVQLNGQPDQEVTVLNRGRGRVVVRRARFAEVDRLPSDDFGLTLTDADGKLFKLSLSQVRQTTDRAGGDATSLITLTARPTAEGQGAPAKLTLVGTRSKLVEVPFTLTDVPVKAGTAPIQDE